MSETKREILGEGYGNPSSDGEHKIGVNLPEKAIRLIAGKIAKVYLGDSAKPIASVMFDDEYYDANIEFFITGGYMRDTQLLFQGVPIENSGFFTLLTNKIAYSHVVARTRDDATQATEKGPTIKRDHIVIKAIHVLAPLRVVVSDYSLPIRAEDTFDFETDEEV